MTTETGGAPEDAARREALACAKRLFLASELGQLDLMARKHTAFESLVDMALDLDATYRPALYGLTGTADGLELAILADAYDRLQIARGDPRRAFRGCAVEIF